MDNSVYEVNGYGNRRDYLEGMSNDYGVPIDFVIELADMLGENEDFDGLITGLEDYGIY